LKVERRGDAAERAVAPRATNGVVVVWGCIRLVTAGGEFGFGEVDDIRMYSETLQQLLFSVQTNKCLLFPSLNLNLGDLVHIHGHPASGKTHLLYLLLATCTLQGKAAVVLDMDGRFNISRFTQLLVNPVDRYLKHIHIFRPTSSDQLAVTLAHLPKYHAKYFPDVALGMVAIHSVDSFYWLDRFKAEQLRLPHSSLQNISSILETIRLSLGSVVVLTDWGLPQHRQALLQEAQDNTHSNPMDLPLIHHITLSVTDTNLEDKHTSGVVKVLGRPDKNFTLRIGPKALSLDVE